MLPLQGAQVRSLAGELIGHMPRGVAQKKKIKRGMGTGSYDSLKTMIIALLRNLTG